MRLGASSWLLDNGERIGVASVYDEKEEDEVSLKKWEVMGWKGSFGKIVGLGSVSRNSSGFLYLIY